MHLFFRHREGERKTAEKSPLWLRVPSGGAVTGFGHSGCKKKRSLNKLGLRVMYMYAIGIRECARQKDTRFRRLLLVTMS